LLERARVFRNRLERQAIFFRAVELVLRRFAALRRVIVGGRLHGEKIDKRIRNAKRTRKDWPGF